MASIKYIQDKNGNIVLPVTNEKAVRDSNGTTLESKLQALDPIDAEVIIGALPASGVSGKIYRVPDTNSYTDYGWNGSAFVPLATFDGSVNDVVMTTAQTLTDAEQVQARENIGVQDVHEAVLGYTETTTTYETQELIANKYFNTNLDTIPYKTGLKTLEGTYCCYLDVVEGEQYRIYGNGGTTALQLYTFAKSDRSVISKSGIMNTRTDGVIVTVPTNAAFLVVNLYGYDSTTDKVEKVVNTSAHIEGLTEKVATLESEVSVLEEDVNGETSSQWVEQSLYADKFYNGNLNVFPSSGSSASALEDCYLCYVYVEEGEIYRIYGQGTTTAVQLYAFADEDKNVIYKSGAMDTRTDGITVTVPTGAAIMCVNLYEYDSTTDKVEKYVETTTGGYQNYVDEKVLPLSGKTIVCFGDSITELTNLGKSYTDYIAEETGATVINVGVGGTQIRRRTTPVATPTTTTEAYAALDIVSMVDAACNQDYSMQTAAAAYLAENADDDNTAIVERLAAIDWTSVSAITILGGTNDWNNASSAWGDSSTTSQDTTFGAMRYIIENLCSVYPKINLLWLSPLVRWVGYSGGAGTAANFSDTLTRNSTTLRAFSQTLSDLAKDLHIPFCDLYNTLGWNMSNFSAFFGENDGTHPTKGFKWLGRKIAHWILANNAMIR